MTERKIVEVPKSQGTMGPKYNPRMRKFMEVINDLKISDPLVIARLQSDFYLMDRYLCEWKGFTWHTPFVGNPTITMGSIGFAIDDVIDEFERTIFMRKLLAGFDVSTILEKHTSKEVINEDCDKYSLAMAKRWAAEDLEDTIS